MTVDNIKTGFQIDRKAASKLLKVSMRTVDRYIKDKKLSTQSIDGRVWLSKKEIEDFKGKKQSTPIVNNVNMSTPPLSIDNRVDNVDTGRQKNVNILSTLETRKRPENSKTHIYKKLFDDLKIELQEKQERLEIANYRVGQLENQLRNSMPLLEYHHETFKKEKEIKTLQTDIKTREKIIKRISDHLKYEKFSKRVFIIILLTLLALQPLWLLLLYK